MFWFLLLILPLSALNLDSIIDQEVALYCKINPGDVEKFRRICPGDLKYYAIQEGRVIGNGSLLPLLIFLQDQFGLPNVEFLYYEGDLPNPPKGVLNPRFPILASSKAKNNSRVCLLPSKPPEVTKSLLEWEKREFKLSIENPNAKTIQYIKNHPDLIASFSPTNKYQLLTNPDHLSNALLFFADSEIVIWPSLFLEPWVHYVPVQKDLSDLMYQLGWALSHQVAAQKMAKTAEGFIQENLNEKLFYMYAYKLLCRLSTLEGE